MINIQKYKTIPITQSDIIVANYLADIRSKYEFHRSGYNYSNISQASSEINNFFQSPIITTFGNTIFGTLSEIMLYKDLTNYLHQKYNSFYIQQSMIQENFIYNLIIGAYDGGYDFIKGKNGIDYTIDVKCYGTKIFKPIDEIDKFNLLVDQRQFDNYRASIYIQTFLLIDSNQLLLIIAGYAISNMLTLDKSKPQPAYRCKVSDLLPYSDLKLKYF